MQSAAGQRMSAPWEDRLYPGLSVRAVPSETLDALARALGLLGVEAEHFLESTQKFTALPLKHTCTRDEGELFLWDLEASARRIKDGTEAFELASQSYLSALESAQADVRRRKDGAAATDVGGSGGWWPAMDDAGPATESLELRLRRCGYAYRHIVSTRISTNVDAIAEQFALLLHALRTLPPAGVLPVTTLYDGLYDLASTFQGHLVPHHLSDLSDDMPGLVTGIALLRHLDATEDRSVDADLAWAREQLADLEKTAAQLATAPSDSERSHKRGGFAGLFQRLQPGARKDGSSSAQAWIEQSRREWRDIINALTGLRGR